MNIPVDIYCERIDPGFWAEPLNAASNGAFLIAAFFALRLIRRLSANAPERAGAGAATAATRPPLPLDSLFLAGMIGVIGVGSFIFHTVATTTAMMADVIPIAIYQLAFLALYARRVMGLSRGRVAMLMLGFVMLGQSASAVAPLLNGSIVYAPAFAFLIGYALYHYLTRQAERFILFYATAIFAVSLTCRSVDMMVCETVPIGVHYAWHILNAVVLYLTTRAYVVGKATGSRPSPYALRASADRTPG